MGKKIQIRNSTAEFLIFTNQAREDGIEVRLQDDTIWLSQKLMATLFDCSTDNIGLHLKNIYNEGELDEKSTTELFSVVATNGKTYNTKHYNLDAIIAVGYRVNSKKATAFRRWATSILRDYAIRGYVIDRERMKNGTFFNENYFTSLLEEVREIRASERLFYQKITDIYATSFDYDAKAQTTLDFFAHVQNKLHFAIHRHTAAELIIDRASSQKEHMGLTSWKNAPSGKIIKDNGNDGFHLIRAGFCDEDDQRHEGGIDKSFGAVEKECVVTVEEIQEHGGCNALFMHGCKTKGYRLGSGA